VALRPNAGHGLLILEVFLDHTQRRTTVSRTSLDEWSARHRDLYLTTHNTHNKHPCSWWDSNPRSQQTSSRSPFEFFILTSNKNIPDLLHCYFTIFYIVPVKLHAFITFWYELFSSALRSIRVLWRQLSKRSWSHMANSFPFVSTIIFLHRWKKGTNCFPLNFVDIITVYVGYVFKKLCAM
jgi:uncharacterized protein Usg